MNSRNFGEFKEGKNADNIKKLFQETENKHCIDSAGWADYFSLLTILINNSYHLLNTNHMSVFTCQLFNPVL